MSQNQPNSAQNTQNSPGISKEWLEMGSDRAKKRSNPSEPAEKSAQNRQICQNISENASNLSKSPQNVQGGKEDPKNANCPQTEATSQVQVNSWVYSDLVKEHFLNPRNFLMGDESKYQYDAEGTVGNPICGDQMRMFLQIQERRIVDVKWKTYGCASAIASTSALSELVKGKTLEDALKVGPEEITEYLGGLPKHKFHCSVLGHEALAAAIADYRRAMEIDCCMKH